MNCFMSSVKLEVKRVCASIVRVKEFSSVLEGLRNVESGCTQVQHPLGGPSYTFCTKQALSFTTQMPYSGIEVQQLQMRRNRCRPVTYSPKRQSDRLAVPDSRLSLSARAQTPKLYLVA